MLIKKKASRQKERELLAVQLELDAMPPAESSSMGSCLNLNMPRRENEEPEQEQASITIDIPGNTENSGIFFMELQEANNIFKAAYNELMKMALEARTWVTATPPLGSLEEFLQIFRSPPPSGMRVERSIESAVVPVSPDILLSIMMDVDRWAFSLSHIVYHVSGQAPAGILRQLSSTDESIKHMSMVNAEFHLPTPFVQPQKFKFLRCLREIIPDIWAIVDLSDGYFPHTSNFALEQKCQRRPSGLIIRRHGNYSQVIWIENFAVYEYQLQDEMCYEMINSYLPFSAKRWVSALIWRLKRDASRFITLKMRVNPSGHAAQTPLLDLTDFMKMVFLDLVNETPNERKWVTLPDPDIKILRNLTMSGSNHYIGVATFQVEAKPLSVFEFLIKKDMELQWSSSLYLEEPEEVIKLASDDDSNCITLHKKVVHRAKSGKNYEYLLQEASTDGFCSFVISAPITQLDVNAAFVFGRWRDIVLQPSGFAIMPGGSDGLHSDVSLVTIAMQQEFNSVTDQAILFVSNLISIIIEEIYEEVSSEGDASSP